MARVWLTYAWADNDQQDIDFIIQSLTEAGLDVQYDRIAIQAGRPIWPQIAANINDPNLNGWIWVISAKSLQSGPNQEEMSLAIDQAVKRQKFPAIGLIIEKIDPATLPPLLRMRLCAMTSDPDWIERVVAGIEGRQLKVVLPEIAPFAVAFHESPVAGCVVEIRPRLGKWLPVKVVVPFDQKHLLSAVEILPRDTPPKPMAGVVVRKRENYATKVADGDFIYLTAVPADVETSVYVTLLDRPRHLKVGNEVQVWEIDLAPGTGFDVR